MNTFTKRGEIAGPAGRIERRRRHHHRRAQRGLAVICHPHPLQGGTMDNKVVTTIARALVQRGWRVVRFDYRGVRQSAGTWDEGRGEVDDALAAIAAHRGAASRWCWAVFRSAATSPRAPPRSSPTPKSRCAWCSSPRPPSSTTRPPVIEDTLLVHGEADDVVPLSASMDWARPQALPVVVVPGAGHFFHGQLVLLKSLVLRFFAE